MVALARGSCRSGERGSLVLEAALVIPVLLLAVLALLQFALWAHTVNVVDDACAYGVREASMLGGSPAAAAGATEGLLQSGLGDYSAGFSVQAQDLGSSAAVDVRGVVPILLPLPGAPALPVHAHLERPKEESDAGA